MSTQLKVLTVADLHQVKKLYRLLARAVESHQPDVVALVGDFLDATGDTEGRLSVEDCAAALSRLRCAGPVFIPGNHDHSGWWAFAEEWRRTGRELHLLEGGIFTQGPLVLMGFPCLMTQSDGMDVDIPVDPNRWLPKLLRPHLPAARALWLMHEPPRSTLLSERSGPMSGQVEWQQAIERFLPRLVIFGHDHRTPIRTKRWHCQLGATTCVNVGQTDEGPLHYSVVEMSFSQNRPCMPRAITVTAYPAGESFTLP